MSSKEEITYVGCILDNKLTGGKHGNKGNQKSKPKNQISGQNFLFCEQNSALETLDSSVWFHDTSLCKPF